MQMQNQEMKVHFGKVHVHETALKKWWTIHSNYLEWHCCNQPDTKRVVSIL
jgi:hypothetical protein